MSTIENSLGSEIENSQRCPNCGAPVASGRDVALAAATCEVCGASLSPSVVAGGNVEDSGISKPPMGNQGKRNPLALVVVAVVAAAMLYFGFHMARRSGPAPPIAKSGPAPDFTLQSLDGNSMRLSDLRGKAVLLNFWATWCSPCKIEMPWFVELQKEYGGQGLQIVGVAMDDASKQEIAQFAKDMGVNYPILIGKESVGDQYGGVPALPETFFIGRDGKLIDKIIGLKGKSEIEDDVKKALNTQPVSAQASAAPPARMQSQK